MTVRYITFAGSTLAVEDNGDRAARIIELLYQYVPAGEARLAQTTYRLSSDRPAAGELQLHRDKVLLYRGAAEGTAAELLLSDTCYQLAAQSRAGLLFHAAGLAWREYGLLLPGASGAGKSTLTAWLALNDFNYLTDELVFVPWGSNHLVPFPRPLHLKRPARTAIEDSFDFTGHAQRILSSSYADLISPCLLRPDNRFTCPPLRLIIFPRYQAGSQFSLTPLSKARAGLKLMQTLINAPNLPHQGFSKVTRLARQAPAYTMRYGSFEQIGQHVEALLASLPD